MSLWKSIAAGVLAGSILAGGATAGYRNNERSFDSAYKAIASESTNSSYRGYIQNYIRGLERNYGDLLPRNRTLRFAFNSEASDHQLFSEAMELYSIAMQNYTAKKPREERHDSGSDHKDYHLVSSQFSDGSIYFTDLNGHGRVKMIKGSDGLYSFIGPKDMFEVVYGRSMVQQGVQNLADGNYWRDVKRAA